MLGGLYAEKVELRPEPPLSVDGAAIVGVTHVMGPEALRAWAEVAVAGGMMAAEKLLEVPPAARQ